MKIRKIEERENNNYAFELTIILIWNFFLKQFYVTEKTEKKIEYEFFT